ncbi:hypothetical protein OC861_004321 [Tilletia horrida]|nr:hypothetical protein OC861_004321 [Tilletia horrida]
MRAFSFAVLSLFAVANAAVVQPRQTSFSSSPLIPASTSTASGTASSSGSVTAPTAISSTTSASTTSSSTPTTTVSYVEPSASAIGYDTIGQPNGNETDSVSNARCTRQTYQVPINVTQTSYDTVKLGVEPSTNQTRITEIFVEYLTAPQNFTQAYVNGTVDVAQTFNISGIYCEPTNTTSNGILQLLVHGVGFDNSYWNIQSEEFDLPEANYSYAYQAAQLGYSTFRYDRIGCGQSEIPADGYNLVQANTEVAILENIAERVRNTTDIGGKSWNKTVLVGHSYGSAQSQRLSQLRPELIDALVLTGYSTSQTGFPYLLLGGAYTQAGLVFDRFANISKHWLVTATQYTDQVGFVYPPSVTPNTTEYVRATANPVTQGTFFSIGAIGAPAENYTGPVQVVLGEKDFIFAFENPYSNGSDFATLAIEQLYPSAASGSIGSIIPATGHGINFHTTAPLAYNATFSWLNSTFFGNGSTTAAPGNGTGSNSTASPTARSFTPFELI